MANNCGKQEALGLIGRIKSECEYFGMDGKGIEAGRPKSGAGRLRPSRVRACSPGRVYKGTNTNKG